MVRSLISTGLSEESLGLVSTGSCLPRSQVMTTVLSRRHMRNKQMNRHQQKVSHQPSRSSRRHDYLIWLWERLVLCAIARCSLNIARTNLKSDYNGIGASHPRIAIVNRLLTNSSTPKLCPVRVSDNGENCVTRIMNNKQQTSSRLPRCFFLAGLLHISPFLDHVIHRHSSRRKRVAVLSTYNVATRPAIPSSHSAV